MTGQGAVIGGCDSLTQGTGFKQVFAHHEHVLKDIMSNTALGKPKPFNWTKTAEDILARERRVLDKLDEIRGNRLQASGVEH